MAQDGDTITYTYSDGTSVTEDVSNVNEAVVDYCDGAGGTTYYTDSGNGGRVENATIDVSGQNALYIWVANSAFGRYAGQNWYSDNGGGGSTEISLSDTNASDSSDEPFLVATGGGFMNYTSPYDGARGGGAQGDAPPKGGSNISDPDGSGAIDNRNRGLVSGGTTIKGGGSARDIAGEVQISYKKTLSPPDPPSNLTAEQQ